MQAAQFFGLDSVAWSLRRFHCPVKSNALVLEVGSGGNPYPRSNVLLDAYESTRERHWVPLAKDRPTVLGFVENLPFKDKVFDFVIASHVLEHSNNPELFLSEIQRVALAGYIEVPDAFMERVNPYRDHRLEITCRNQTLVIRKKSSWQQDPEIVEIYEDKVKKVMTGEFIPSRPFDFHVRYYWNNKIAYKVLNPEVDATWQAPASNGTNNINISEDLRKKSRDLLRHLFSQRSRNSKIDLTPLLRCSKCHSESVSNADTFFLCDHCGMKFPIRKGIAVMNESNEVNK
jgi:SAM-dependent methyltransferase